jgi:hypothetical protein
MMPPSVAANIVCCCEGRTRRFTEQWHAQAPRGDDKKTTLKTARPFRQDTFIVCIERLFMAANRTLKTKHRSRSK